MEVGLGLLAGLFERQRHCTFIATRSFHEQPGFTQLVLVSPQVCSLFMTDLPHLTPAGVFSDATQRISAIISMATMPNKAVHTAVGHGCWRGVAEYVTL